jgi:uncharacterized protein (DUF1800 family)
MLICDPHDFRCVENSRSAVSISELHRSALNFVCSSRLLQSLSQRLLVPRRLGWKLATLWLTCALAACGNGAPSSNGSSLTKSLYPKSSQSPPSDPSSSTSQTSSSERKPTIVPPSNPTAAEAARFLTQATFGPTEADIKALSASTFPAWLAAQTTAPISQPTHLGWEEQRLAQLSAGTPQSGLTVNQFYESFWEGAATAPDQLRQRVAFALSQIFVVSFAGTTVDARGPASYLDMLNNDAFGNFRTILTDVTYHPMMGTFLTYAGNQKESSDGTRTPDQNYARELMQLMTIGLYALNVDGTVKTDGAGNSIPTYTQSDVIGLAKVFTGLSWYSPAPSSSTYSGIHRDPNSMITPMMVYNQYHSTSEKDFLGTKLPASSTADTAGDIKIALDTLFNHPNVGPFLAQRLIQQLVTSNPSPAYVQRVASVFNNNGNGVRGDMAAVVTAILNDPEARDMGNVSVSSFGKLREPLIRLTNWMRAFQANSQSGEWLMNSTATNKSLSEAPLTAPSVFNFWRPGYSPPTPQLASHNLLSPEFQVTDPVSVASYLNFMQITVVSGVGLTPISGSGHDITSAYSAELSVANDAGALVDRMNFLLLYGQMSAGLHQKVLDAVSDVAVPVSGTEDQVSAALLKRVQLAVFLTMASPEYITQR